MLAKLLIAAALVGAISAAASAECPWGLWRDASLPSGEKWGVIRAYSQDEGGKAKCSAAADEENKRIAGQQPPRSDSSSVSPTPSTHSAQRAGKRMYLSPWHSAVLVVVVALVVLRVTSKNAKARASTRCDVVRAHSTRLR